MRKNNLLKHIIFIFYLSIFGIVFAQENLINEPITLDTENNISLNASLFENVNTGYHLTITYKKVKGAEQKVSIFGGEKNPFMYGPVYGGSLNKAVITPDKSSGKITYVLVARDVAAVRKNGIIIKGEGLKVTQVICEPAPVPKAKKVEIKAETPKDKFEAKPVPKFEDNTPVAIHGKLNVEGAYLFDEKGNPFMLYGMSTHGLAWFPQYVNKAGFKTLRDDWNTNCVRLALYTLENGGYCAGGNKEQLKNLIFKGIDVATELGMYVIVDWHVLNFNPLQNLDDAMIFFSEISQRYANYDNVIYELCNEPTGAPWNTAIKPYAENLIPMIRKNAPNSLIIVGTNTWSQDIQDALANPLKFKNIMYAFHFYADTHKDNFRDRVETCINGGLPVFITEFGTCNASGNGGFNIPQSEKWFDLIEEYNISHMNWSLANKNETASVIDAGCSKISDWTYDDLTESGKLIHDHFNKLYREHQ